MKLARLAFAGILVWGAASALIPALFESARDVSLVYTLAPRFDPDAWMRGGERYPEGASLEILTGRQRRRLVSGFHSSADAGVSFDGRRILFSGRKTSEDPWQIWEIPVDGGVPRQVTNWPDDCVRPLYLPGDRVVYARRQGDSFRLESGALSGSRPLWLTYAPGNFFPSFVLHDGRVLFQGPHPSAQTELFTMYSDATGVEAVRCDHGSVRRNARQIASGDILFSTPKGLARFTPSLALQVDVASLGGEIAGPVAETAPGVWVVSLKAAGTQHFRLVEWPSKRTVATPASAHAVLPVAVLPREVPKIHPSALHNWDGANLLCLNVYESPLQLAPGSVASLRVYSVDEAGASTRLGQAPVESDGSFYVQVPSEKPLRLELADRAGRLLAAEKGWFWMRRGEQRICVGCHAGPERAPDNAVPQVLLKSTKPAKIGGGG